MENAPSDTAGILGRLSGVSEFRSPSPKPSGWSRSSFPVGLLHPLQHAGLSRRTLSPFPPDDARHDAGYQLEKVQRGEQPDDFKPMAAIGKGVEEIRITEESGAYRVIYVARRADAVYVLNAFQKKTQATPKKDVDTAMRRFAQLPRGAK